MSTGNQYNKNIIIDVNIHEHFRETLSTALANQRVVAEEETVFYLVNLLAHFTKSENLFELGPSGPCLQPLALLYAQAVQAEKLEARRQTLRRLGDVALLISGIFSGYLSRKLVDVDYYIGMGSSAYSYLSDTHHDSLRSMACNEIFAELSTKFRYFVDVLAEVSEISHLSPPTDILRIYEVWAKTGSQRAANKLRRMGISPLPNVQFWRQN